jgi:hypothetical protein
MRYSVAYVRDAPDINLGIIAESNGAYSCRFRWDEELKQLVARRLTSAALSYLSQLQSVYDNLSKKGGFSLETLPPRDSYWVPSWNHCIFTEPIETDADFETIYNRHIMNVF